MEAVLHDACPQTRVDSTSSNAKIPELGQNHGKNVIGANCRLLSVDFRTMPVNLNVADRMAKQRLPAFLLMMTMLKAERVGTMLPRFPVLIAQFVCQ